ncbi:MAG: hypothetical protein VR72_09375 [Clostridiaceae bacterium BRH_c20a]|nr:MAG: hypothetical protein VR72_09375 [Clostridiaceae bacterium BRH_c20a]
MNKSCYGYSGKILRVDLTTGVFGIESTMKYAHKWLGQRGIGQSILYNELKPWVTPYEPANKVIIETGPLTGTLVPGASRFSISSKNAFNGGVGTSSCGGFFGPELKFAGYDFVIIEGRAQMPVYLWIYNNDIVIRDARHLWGKTTWEAQDSIKEELKDERVHVACIGPAGENLARGACVISGNRAAGKCGMGGIFGSKNLKAIAVRGTGAVEVAHPERFMKAVNEAFKREESSESLKKLSEYGTISGTKTRNKYNSLPYKNFKETQIPNNVLEQLSPDIYKDNYSVRSLNCMACSVSCCKAYFIDHGPYAGLYNEGFHLNTLADYAGKCGVEYPPAIIKIQALCNQLGLDLDASAGAISWAMECYQRGILTQNDTDGLKLEWGNHELIVQLIWKIANRDGFGDILAEGCKKAAEIIGRASEEFAIHVKGQELYEEIRSPLGWGLGACVATRGGGHTTGAPAFELYAMENTKVAKAWKKFLGITEVDPISYKDKPEIVLYFEREQELINSLGICMTHGTWLDPTLLGIPELCELYSAATGIEVNEKEMIKIADRVLNIEKAFNILHSNFTRIDDFPPERFFKEEIKSGLYKGFLMSKEDWGNMLDRYYFLREWELQTGLPTRQCLEKLDLEDVANELEENGRIGKDS